MSASSSYYVPRFDVFLSFSAEDTTTTFVSDLYRSLSEKGISTYYKDDKLEERASSFGSDIRKCLVATKTAVVVVSESYPTSVLCLNELQAILNLRDEGQLSVLLIYCGVDSSYIRKQTTEFAEPFRNLGEEYSSDKVRAWRRALTKLTSISGLDSRFWSKEAKMADLISNEISLLVTNKLNSPSTSKSDGLVALDRHMQALYELLDLKSDKEVRLVGIWGSEGVGKTTLARYAYEEMSVNFHAHMFVDNSEKNYHQHHLEPREIQEGAQTMTKSSDVIKSALGHRNGLLVIDCVDSLEQLKDIAEIVGWFGSGSRVIFTTQEKNLLDEFGVKHVYEVKSLRYDEALELFSQSAFKKKCPPTNFESLSLRAVQIASFLPLSLTILGSSLQDKDEKTWEEALQKLEGDQDKTIMEVLEKTYTRANEE
ncbi:unnamed protein product [Arabis nemorensis]|uniref:TIR domain-containing protein n=1 Tax=Arabis nemorensis TaxID=586526 RepID=A0A565B2H8_9BRAS|nr:unnamed protein product [Arabis nemorensis]